MSDDQLDTGAAVRQYLGQRDAVAARAAVSAAAGTSGDLEAELRRVSERTGVPISSARAMPDEVKRRAAISETMEAVQRFPSTLAYLADESNARLAHDDVGALTGVEAALGATAKYLVSAPGVKNTLVGDVGAGVQRASRGAAGLAAAPLEFVAPAFDALESVQAIGGNPVRRLAEGFRMAGAAAEAKATRMSPPSDSIVQGGISSGVQSLTQNLLAFGTGNAAAALGIMTGTTGGNSYLKAREKGVDTPQSILYGASDAAIEFATEAIPVGRLFGDLKAGTPLFATMLRQAGAEIPGEQIATLLQDLNEWAALNSDKPFSAYLKERPSAAAQTLIATLVGVGGNVAVMKSLQNVADTAAGVDRSAEALADLMKAAGGSKLRERDATAFAAFVERAAADSGAPAEVFIDAQTFGEVLAQSGIPLEQLAAALPSVAGQFTEALATGGDVVIPVGELAAGIAGSPLEQALMQHVRTSPEALSQAEAKTAAGEKQMRAIADQMFAEQDAQSADTTSRDAVRKVVLDELNKAGRFTPDVNAAYADLTAQFFATQAARLGVTPEALFAKHPLKVRAEGGFGEMLQQRQTTASTQDVVDAWRAALAKLNPRDLNFVPALRTPAVLRALGLKQPTLALPTRVLMQIASDHPDVPEQVLRDLPALLSDPLFVYPHKDGGLRVVVDATTAKGEPIAVGVSDGRIHTITPIHHQDGAGGPARLAQAVAAEAGKKGKLYARNKEALVKTRASASAPDGHNSLEALPRSRASVVTRESLVNQHGENFYQDTPAGWGSVAPGDSPNNMPPGKMSKGLFSPSTNTITLLARADLSTFLHESGHFYLEVLADLASQPNAPAEIVEDMGKVLAWFGVADITTWQAMSLDEQRDSHEKFARGFEAYLFEGKAPTTAIGRVFDRFKTWMLAVYKSIKALNVDLNPEVRGVFDRLLASQEEIQRAEQARELAPLFKTAAAAGMTPAEFASYQALGAEATGDAVDALQRRSLRDMRWLSNARSRRLREMQKDADDKRKAVRAEVAAEIDAQPVEQARAALKKLAEADPETKAAIKAWGVQRAAQLDADRAAVKAEFFAREPGLTGLLKGQFLAKNKREIENEAERRTLEWERANPRPARPSNTPDLDPVAEAYGFDSGDALARALAEAPDRRDLIDAMTDQHMLERHGELADQQAIERAVDEALHNESRARFVATELSALDKAIGKPRVLMAAARQLAADLIGRKQVKDVRVGTFTAAEVCAAKEAAGTKDIAVRAAAKRHQLLNHYAAKAAGKALDEVEKGLAYLKRVGDSTSLPADYADQVHALLERYDLRSSTTLKDIARRQSLAGWLESQRERGVEPDIPAVLLETVDRRSYKELTVDEFRGLVDTVRQIEHLGRRKDKLLTAEDQREFDAVKDTIVASIEANSRGRTADTRTPNTRIGQALLKVKAFGAAHIKAATWARVMDGGEDGGPVWEYLIRGANEAGDRETRMRAQATRDLTALVQPLLADGPMGGKGKFFEGIPTAADRERGKTGSSFNREARLAIALNWGNESNRQRLLGGEGWTERQVMPVLQSLTPAEWQFAQKVWDYFEGYRPQVAAKERRVYGREPAWIDPAPVQITLVDGTSVSLRGGYYPVKYDPRASARAAAHNEAEEAKALMRAAYTSATTRRSFTKTRADEVHGRPLLYSLDGIYNGVQEVIHDLSWHEWLIDANRLVKNPAIAAAMRNTYGPDAHQQFKSWLQDVAQGDKPARDVGEMAVSWLRQNVSVAGLGMNVMSAAMQPLGLTQSIVRIGPEWVGRGLAKAIASPISTAGEIAGMSDFMHDRFMTQFRELNEVRNRVKGQGRGRRTVDAAAYALMLQAQRMVDVPTWWGMYEKALASGNAEDRAVALADQAVIDSQGSGMTKDLSAIERGSPYLKLFTTFYSFFNTTLNLGVGQTMTSESKARLAADHLLLFTVPAVLGSLLKDALTPGDAGDDPDKLARKLIGAQLSYLFGLMFVLRELGSPAANIVEGKPHMYSGPAGIRVLVDLIKVTEQVAQGEADDGLRKAIVNVAGELLRLPAAQANRTITGAKALAEGKTQNPAALVMGFQEH